MTHTDIVYRYVVHGTTRLDIIQAAHREAKRFLGDDRGYQLDITADGQHIMTNNGQSTVINIEADVTLRP